MLQTKKFNNFVLDNIDLPVIELTEKFFAIDKEIAQFITSYLTMLLMPKPLNHSIIIICCSIIEYLKYKIQRNLEPSDN
jgi:hypothetical protein